MSDTGGSGASTYKEGLKRFSPFYLTLDVFVLAVLAFYRIGAHFLLLGISPDLVAGEKLRDYFAAALPSDLLSTAFIMAALAAGWLLSPVFRKMSALVSTLFVAAYAAFMILATDFLRVYQVAFGRNYVGSEHFTGVKSMLISAAAEISAASRISLAVAFALLLISSILALGKRMRPLEESLFRMKRLVAFAMPLTLALGLLSSAMAGGNPARMRGEELGRNPVSALASAAGSASFKPPSAGNAAKSAYNTDSLENPGADRFLPRIKKGRYNIILYFFESTSWKYYELEHNGEKVLPVMHSLAKNGLLLRNHYSNYPLSANTMFSVMSSRYSMYGKSFFFSEYHDVDVNTISEILSGEGYSTCLIHTGDLLYASRNKFLANRSIDKFILYEDLMENAKYRKNVGWGADERLMVEPAIDWIKSQSSPFFLMVAPVNPHHPYAVPDDFQKIADPEESGIGPGEKTWRNYLNSLHYADAAMGYLIDGLERENLMKNTLFVMVTDHGEAFYQHRGNYNHPLFIYEENVHVPALFYSKTLFPTGIEMESVTRHIDIMPSILDLLGIEDRTARDGESIFSHSREKMAVVHTSWNDELMGVRDGRWKYIRRMKDSGEELYDLGADPVEKKNIAEDNPTIVERYRKVSDEMASYMLEQYRHIARKKPIGQ
jgi:phosphoglycerol transferase MdoB-like AlkP superfamily enzyme